MTSEYIDRSYGNSPYFFYNHYPEGNKTKEDDTKHSPLRSKMFYEDPPEYPSA